MPLNRVREAIEAIKKGEMIVMMDDEERENEGDLVYAGTFSTPEKVNFMASEAKGLICVALTNEIAQRLELTPMVSKNSSQYETAFTVSVDASECTTGISAYERDMTIKKLSDPLSKTSELSRPGHIFPLIAKEGGVLVRTGHTEGSVDLCRLAGVYQSAVICEIMREDGHMARRDDLREFSKKYNLKTVYISDIVEYRLKNETLISIEKEECAEFFEEPTKRLGIRDHRGYLHTVYIFKEIEKSSFVKFHNIAPDIDILSSKQKLNSMLNAVEILKKEGGVLIFLDSRYCDGDKTREFGIGAQILRTLGVEHIKLLTSHAKKEYVGITGFGLDIEQELCV